MWREQIPRIQFTARSESVPLKKKKERVVVVSPGRVSPTPMKKQLARLDPSCSLCARALLKLLFGKRGVFFLRVKRICAGEERKKNDDKEREREDANGTFSFYHT